MLIYLASGDVVLSGQSDVQIPLVVAQVEVDFTSIVKNEDFSVPTVGSAQGLEYIEVLISYSVGAIVPASTFMYGSILMEDTCIAGQYVEHVGLGQRHIFKPIVLSRRPVEEAGIRVSKLSKDSSAY